jgi:PEP-CTERM motif
MLNRPRRTAAWYRYVLGAGAVIALTAVGAAAMWTGWLPSRPLQWNDINGRLNLGDPGAGVRGERPIIVNQWPSAGALGYQARGEGLTVGGSSNAATFAERFARRDDRDDGDKGSARWGAKSKSYLTGTAGRSRVGAGIGGAGGGLGSGGGVAQVPKDSSKTEVKTTKVASSPKPSSPGHSGARGGAPTPAPAPPATVGDLATNIPGTGVNIIGAGISGPGIGIQAGGNAGLAATPEPASLILIGTGALAAALFRRQRK